MPMKWDFFSFSPFVCGALCHELSSFTTDSETTLWTSGGSDNSFHLGRSYSSFEQLLSGSLQAICSQYGEVYVGPGSEFLSVHTRYLLQTRANIFLITDSYLPPAPARHRPPPTTGSSSIERSFHLLKLGLLAGFPASFHLCRLSHRQDGFIESFLSSYTRLSSSPSSPSFSQFLKSLYCVWLLSLPPPPPLLLLPLPNNAAFFFFFFFFGAVAFEEKICGLGGGGFRVL